MCFFWAYSQWHSHDERVITLDPLFSASVRWSHARNARAGDAHAGNARGSNGRPHAGPHGRADGRRTATGRIPRLWGGLSRHIRSPSPSRQWPNVELLHCHSRPGECRPTPLRVSKQDTRDTRALHFSHRFPPQPSFHFHITGSDKNPLPGVAVSSVRCVLTWFSSSKRFYFLFNWISI